MILHDPLVPTVIVATAETTSSGFACDHAGFPILYSIGFHNSQFCAAYSQVPARTERTADGAKDVELACQPNVELQLNGVQISGAHEERVV